MDSPFDDLVAKPCDKLLRDAKRVFGDDMVVAAWHTDSAYDLEHAKRRLEAYQSEYEETEDRPFIDLSTCREVMFEFSNGVKVIIGTSEWGSIERPKGSITEV